MTTYIWSIDDAGLGDSQMVESLRRTTDYFSRQGIQSTWFVVPKPNGTRWTPEWLDALQAARDSGHDIQLHGLTHEDCYEFGPPAWPATAILNTLAANFDKRREELMPRYTLAKMQARIEEGLDIFARQLDVQPAVFRAPCSAICKPMFEALRQLGIGYHSAAFVSASGYEHLPHNSGVLSSQWSDDYPHRPYRWYSDVVEAPILNEYTWRGSGKRSAEFVALAKQDLERAAKASPIVVLLMHTHGIADDYEHAFRVIDAVIEQVEQAGGDFATFADVVKSGALAAAATEIGPDLLQV